MVNLDESEALSTPLLARVKPLDDKLDDAQLISFVLVSVTLYVKVTTAASVAALLPAMLDVVLIVLSVLLITSTVWLFLIVAAKKSAPKATEAVAIGVVVLLGMTVFSASLNSTYRAVLFNYANTGETRGFNKDTLDHAFTTR